ncbi:MAG: FKBP-type peptidyl-prolyl cis-trans isomerase [Bacteroidales bacterium]|jgi:FKBP-type peptidyl-prolyl cis-trans isomerase|nr:FKBP-type peptidyl-prolyl cis-trans isomerase [Bacteroidales bacterium]
MNKTNLLIITLVSILVSACTGVSVEKAKIKTAQDSVSYVIGADYGTGISEQMETFPGGMNSDEFLKAFIASFKGEESAITVEDSRTYIMNYVQAAQAAEADSTGDSTASAPTNIDSVSYIVGVDYGSGISEQMVSFPGGMNEVAFLEAFVTTFNGDSAKLKIEDSRNFIMEYVNKAQAIVDAESAGDVAAAAAEGIKFLEENAKKEGVVTTASGLQYTVISEGTGAKPTTESTVSVHYHGTLLDGTVFDSSVERDAPASFGVSQVIKGWTEGLQLMSVGSKYKLYIPSELAYGANPPGKTIPANAVLIFEVELLEIL